MSDKFDHLSWSIDLVKDIADLDSQRRAWVGKEFFFVTPDELLMRLEDFQVGDCIMTSERTSEEARASWTEMKSILDRNPDLARSSDDPVEVIADPRWIELTQLANKLSLLLAS